MDYAKREQSTIILLSLPLKITEMEIYKFFRDENCGKIRDIKVVRDPKTGRSKGIAYVEFYSPDSVLKAL